MANTTILLPDYKLLMCCLFAKLLANEKDTNELIQLDLLQKKFMGNTGDELLTRQDMLEMMKKLSKILPNFDDELEKPDTNFLLPDEEYFAKA